MNLSAASAKRVSLPSDPFPTPGRLWDRGRWPAKWIGDSAEVGQSPVVLAFRRIFTLKKNTTFRACVTADERYELYLDGKQIGRGSERGDMANWFYETYQFELPAGEHILVAKVWWQGEKGGSPCAQISSLHPRFLFAPIEEENQFLSTGKDGWKSKKLPAYSFQPPYQHATYAGARIKIDGSTHDWEFPSTHSRDDWQPAVLAGTAASDTTIEYSDHDPILRRATLPPMLENPVRTGAVRHVEILRDDTNLPTQPILARNSTESEITKWNKLLAENSPLHIPANTKLRILIDLENYFCAYPQITLSGGNKSTVEIHWAEGLQEKADSNYKGNRNQIEGKFFNGFGDIFETDGGEKRLFEPLWWSAGRYIQILIRTKSEPLRIDSFNLLETHYPYEFHGKFQSSDSRLDALLPLFRRSLEMCSHETFMDCPYYEQMMYVGDTRLEILVAYALTGDRLLARKALALFDSSRFPNGLTTSRYPSRKLQLIPPFSLWWICMVRDYLYWQDDDDFVKSRMAGVRAVLESFREKITPDGLVDHAEGWNFVDWAVEWENGVPPFGDEGISPVINFQIIHALLAAADMEQHFGEASLADRNRTLAEKIHTTLVSRYWDEKSGLFAENPQHTHFCEHSQCLAILSGLLDAEKIARISSALCDNKSSGLVRTTIYFSHYLFETFAKIGRIDCLLERLESWQELLRLGLRTTIESPEPTRSDCHAWGAHPAFHYFATILGIRPATPRFSEIRIAPQLGSLKEVSATFPHPSGNVTIQFTQTASGIAGEINLPEKLKGTLILGEKEIPLKPGRNTW